MITDRKEISINAVGDGPIIFTTPISQLPDLVKNYLWKGYFNVMITGIDEFDLDQESDGKLKVTVHCKY